MNHSTLPQSSDNKLDKGRERPRVELIDDNYRKLRADMKKLGDLTESQIFLAKRCAGLLALLEMWEQKFCSDKAVPTGTWNACVNTVRRLMQDIGLTQDSGAWVSTPDLREYLDENSDAPSADVTHIAKRKAG